MEELAKQIQSYVDAHNDPDNVYTVVVGGLEKLWLGLCDSKSLDKSRSFKETEPAQRPIRGRAW